MHKIPPWLPPAKPADVQPRLGSLIQPWGPVPGHTSLRRSTTASTNPAFQLHVAGMLEGSPCPGGSPGTCHCPSPAPISQELTPKGHGLQAQVPPRPSAGRAARTRHPVSHPSSTISRHQCLLVPSAESLPFQPPSTIPAADLSDFSKQLGNYRLKHFILIRC